MAINHKAAKEFAKRWAGKNWSEDQFSGVFWIDLLKSVYNIECNDTNNIIFEYRTSASGKIDLWLRNLSTMIEMKSSGVDLDKPELRQGELKTPFKQVYDYAVSFPRNEQPDYLITCNFDKFRVYSRKEHGDINLEKNGIEFTVNDLGDKPEYLSFLVDPQNSRLYQEREISETAGDLIGKLYDMLREQYLDPNTEESKHSLNVLCVRLVFCLFCEDAGLFGEMDAFYNYLKDVPSPNIRNNLQRLFKALDTPREKRDPYDTPIKVFPYVNGGLFRDNVEIPNFTDEIKDFLLNSLSRGVDWSKISPTIFGGIFESTLNPETRRKGGMHYTSPENIHKVIDPLFLDNLKVEFDSIRKDEELSVIQKRNRYKKFHHKLCTLTFLDPAAGSGNFLTETYICLRKLEFAVISEMNRGKNIGMFDSATEGEIQEYVKLSQFYGIEINDFAVSVAETALWISRLKANQEAVIVYDLDEMTDFPLEERANIICDNALRFNWSDLIEPSKLSYIMGNPPFIGARMMDQDSEEKEDVHAIFGNIKEVQDLDYVTCWYKVAANYIHNTNIEVCFVSTNSICQGSQVPILWKVLLEECKIHINFAYQTFRWNSQSMEQAAVHCIIVAFAMFDRSEKYIYPTDNQCVKCKNISPYLTDADSIFVEAHKDVISLGVPKMNMGNMARDGGHFFIKDETEKNTILAQEPDLEKWIHPLIGAEEFIKGKKRWCFWLEGISEDELNKSPILTNVVSEVKQFRLSSNAKTTKGYAKTPHLFAQRCQPDDNFIVIPVVSSENRNYIPIGFLSPDNIPTTQVQIIPSATIYLFGILTSALHMAWMRSVAGRLKSDYRYSKEIVYNNFPWPTPSDEQKISIEKSAQAILDTRSEYPNRSLADLYDPNKMPLNLKNAHETNDRAVMDAYGFGYDMTEPEIVAALMKLYQKLTEDK